MSTSNLIRVIPPTLPSGFCFTTWQALSNTLFQGLQVDLSTNAGTLIVIGSTVPAPEYRAYLWFRQSSDANLVGLYQWIGSAGGWCKAHPIQTADFIQMWIGDATTIATIDGGDSGALGDASGPMWEIFTSMAARMPLGAGTLPSATVIGVGDTGGEEEHTLVEAEIPEHDHDFTVIARNLDGSGSGALCGGTELSPVTNDGQFDGTTDTYGDGLAHNNLPPYYGVHFIRRTARKYYFGGA